MFVLLIGNLVLGCGLSTTPLYQKNRTMKYALLDTNTFLHYHLFTEIDWCSILNTEEVEVIVSTTVLQELDKKKFSEQDIRIKNRAKKVISTFNLVLENKIPFKKDKASLKFISTEPKIDWNKENLDSLILDDRIIATCIELIEKHNDLTLVTADFGLKLKARNKSIPIYELDDNYLLKEKPTKEQDELLELREKLKKFEVTFPNLFLKLASDSNQTDFISFEIIRQADYPEEKIKIDVTNKVNEILTIAENKIQQNNNPFIGNIGWIRQEDIDAFKEKVKKYENDLLGYYKNLWEYNEFLSRLLEIDFVFTNEGSSPGKDIDINIHFPDGFKVCDEKEIPHKPSEPKIPAPPMTLAESMQSLSSASFLNFSYLGAMNRPTINSIPTVKNFSSPSIRKTNSYEVEYHIISLKHKSSHTLDPIYVYFENYSEIKSFSVDYSILAANYPEKFVGKLNIIVTLK